MASPSVTPVKEKITRERTVPPEELQREAQSRMPELWDYLESLTEEQWTDHIVYLYRNDPKPSQYPAAAGQPSFLEKYTGTIEIRPGVTVPMSDAGTIQTAIKEKFGGRVFRMIVKRGRERVTEGTFVNEAPPRYPDLNPQYASPIPNATVTPGDPNAVAAKAIDAMASQQPDAVRLAMEVLSKASEIVMRQSNPPAAHVGSNLVDQAVIQTLLNRALNPPPPPDPLEQILKYKELFASPKNGVTETLELVGALKTAGLFGVGGKTSLLDLGAQVLPQVAQTAAAAIHEWRLGVEAQRDGAIYARTNPQPEPARVIEHAIPAPTTPAAAPAAAPPQPQSPPENNDPPFQWITIKIAEIVKDLDLTVDQAVDETLSFLYIAQPGLIPLLLDPPKLHPMLKPGEEGLLMLFQNEPALKTVQINPRLTEFIKKFITAAKESESQDLIRPEAGKSA